MTIAIYPGSFDPITNGHIDIATRAARIFEKLIISVFALPDKQLVFDIDERVEMATHAVKHLPNVEVKPYKVLTGDFARQVNARVMVRGSVSRRNAGCRRTQSNSGNTLGTIA